MVARAKAQADAYHCSEKKIIKLQPRFLSKKYLKFSGIDAFTSNATLVVGSRIPKIVTNMHSLFEALRQPQPLPIE